MDYPWWMTDALSSHGLEARNQSYAQTAAMSEAAGQADNRTGNPSETPTPLPLGLIKITCQRDSTPDQHLVSLFHNRKQLPLWGGRGGRGGKKQGKAPFITLLVVQRIAITGKEWMGISRGPVGMILSSSRKTDKKSKLLNLNHRWRLILNNGFRVESEICLRSMLGIAGQGCVQFGPGKSDVGRERSHTVPSPSSLLFSGA